MPPRRQNVRQLKPTTSPMMKPMTKKILIGVGILIVVAIIVAVVIIFTRKSTSKTPTKPHTEPHTNPTPKSQIIGLWTNKSTCGLAPAGGTSSFNLIALSSALPQDYATNSTSTTSKNSSDPLTKFFSSKIVATYGEPLRKSSIDYIISIGGSNATLEGWLNLINEVSTSAGVKYFYDACVCRGLSGIDLDIELADESGQDDDIKKWLNGLVKLMSDLKALDNKFIIQVTVLLGRPSWLAVLCANQHLFDYFGIMLYNGGMYAANKPNGAGCSWDGWAELVLSGGKAGCTTPLNSTTTAYINQTGINKIPPSKIICGMITDTDPAVNIRMNVDINNRMLYLVNHYKGAGVMIWLLPGWTDFSKSKEPDNNALLKSLGYVYDTDKCMVNCPTINKCTAGTTCVASNCGKVLQKGVDDAACAPCGNGQTYWPCNDGLCVIAGSEPPQPVCN